MRPPLDGRRERIVERLLGKLEVAEEADEGGEHAARVGAVDLVHEVAQRAGPCALWFLQSSHLYCWLKSTTGLTSMLPRRADGIFDAT